MLPLFFRQSTERIEKTNRCKYAIQLQRKFDPEKIRIAYAANYFSKLDSTYNDWKVLEAYKKIGVKLSAIVFPDSSIYGFDMIGIVIGSESAAAFDEMTRLNMDDQLTRQTASDWPNYFRSARFIPAVEYVNANRHRYILMQKINEIIRNYDVIICPTWSGQQVAITNLTGHPALCMPTGLDGRSLPTSITFIGKLYSEAVLLAVGKAFQDPTDFETCHPPYFQR